MGYQTSKIPLGDYQFVVQYVNIFPTNNPLLIGLDIVNEYRMYVYTVSNKLYFLHIEMEVSLVL